MGSAETPAPSAADVPSDPLKDPVIPPGEGTPAGPGIYVHVPFCRARCGYCDFFSTLGPASERRAFLRDLLREIDLVAAGGRFAAARFATVFFGGGTPSLLTGREAGRVLEALRGAFGLADGAEITLEANPESLSPGRAGAYRAGGINRISLGVQSLDPGELRFLGRIHTALQARRRVAMLRRAGFDNLSLDLIYGIPGSPPALWEKSLDAALALAPEHLSAYLLTLEGGEPLVRRLAEERIPLVGEETAREQYELLRRKTAAAGLAQYEISSFARPGRESRHNCNYWVRGEYLGLGPSAHSHRSGRRWSNPASMEGYCRALQEGHPAWEGEEAVSPLQEAEEALFLGLRLTAGIDYAGLLDRLPPERHGPLTEGVRRIEERGLLTQEKGRLRLLPEGYFVSDAVFGELIGLLA
jgi:oxygen-independent coproporphyrinogen III oxidase